MKMWNMGGKSTFETATAAFRNIWVNVLNGDKGI